MTEMVTVEQFAEKEGQPFELFVDATESLPLTLVEVKAGKPSRVPEKFRHPFSLLFEGTPGRLCPQAMYRIRHTSGWEFDVFLVPVGDKPDGSFIYQAVFA